MSKGARIDDVYDCVDSFESLFHRNGGADLAEFLPSASHPEYLDVLKELVCVDLELAWTQQNRLTTTQHYIDRFPALGEDKIRLQEIAFEEFRQRQAAGEHPDPADFAQRYGIVTHHWVKTPDQTPANSFSQVDKSTFRENTAAPESPNLPCAIVTDTNQAFVDSGSSFSSELEEDSLFPSDLQAFARKPAVDKPDVGDDFLDFALVQKLGQGAVGSVFLAVQKHLSDRPVALKISTELSAESKFLARLQHTNIVPVYSIHRQGCFQAVCMPFVGSLTFADLLKQLRKGDGVPKRGSVVVAAMDRSRGQVKYEQPNTDELGIAAENRDHLCAQSYVEAILSLFCKLTDGLRHAHARQIVHRDLKPANILLSDEAEPMLLDFNLSEDLDAGFSGVFGGTIPYMAPETIRSFQANIPQTDPRGDVYSLGFILFEMLTLKPPFPVRKGSVDEIAKETLRDRQQLPPNPREINPAVPAGLAAIVQKALHPDVDKRYQSAKELAEDLVRQRDHRPLKTATNPSWVELGRKWAVRHPRLTSSSGVLVVSLIVAALILSVTFAAFQQIRHTQRERDIDQFVVNADEVRTYLYTPRHDSASLQEGGQVCEQTLAQYMRVNDKGKLVPNDDYEKLDSDQKTRVNQILAELLLLKAKQQRLLAKYHHNHWKEREKLLAKSFELNELADQYSPIPMKSQRLQRAKILELEGKEQDYQRALQQARATDSNRLVDRLMFGIELFYDQKYLEALAEFEEARQIEPKNLWVFMLLGKCQMALGNHYAAKENFDNAILIKRDFEPAYRSRALCLANLHLYKPAIEDISLLMRLNQDDVRLKQLLSEVLNASGEYAQALEVLRALEREGISSTLQYATMSECALMLQDQHTADRYWEKANNAPKRGEIGFEILIEGWLDRGKPEKALEIIEEWFVDLPRAENRALSAKARVLDEHLGKTEEAIVLMDRVVKNSQRPLDRALRGVFLAHAGHRDKAVAEAEMALSLDQSPRVSFLAARIYAQTSKQNASDFRQAIHYLREAINGGYGTGRAFFEKDLEDLRTTPEFKLIFQQRLRD